MPLRTDKGVGCLSLVAKPRPRAGPSPEGKNGGRVGDESQQPKTRTESSAEEEHARISISGEYEHADGPSDTCQLHHHYTGRAGDAVHARRKQISLVFDSDTRDTPIANVTASASCATKRRSRMNRAVTTLGVTQDAGQRVMRYSQRPTTYEA